MLVIYCSELNYDLSTACELLGQCARACGHCLLPLFSKGRSMSPFNYKQGKPTPKPPLARLEPAMSPIVF